PAGTDSHPGSSCPGRIELSSQRRLYRRRQGVQSRSRRAKYIGAARKTLTPLPPNRPIGKRASQGSQALCGCFGSGGAEEIGTTGSINFRFASVLPRWIPILEIAIWRYLFGRHESLHSFPAEDFTRIQ